MTSNEGKPVSPISPLSDNYVPSFENADLLRNHHHLALGWPGYGEIVTSSQTTQTAGTQGSGA